MNTDKEQSMDGQTATHAEPTGSSLPRPGGSEGDDLMDQSIRAAIHQGDLRTATALCARYHGSALGRVCMALVGNQAEADELVQDTLLTAHQSFASYRGEGKVAAWLFGIARRKCARHVEQRQRHERKLKLVHDAERPPATDDLLERRRRAERARALLGEIRPSEREALVLRYVGGLSYREVAEACGLEEAAARKRVSRALITLRNLLRDEE